MKAPKVYPQITGTCCNGHNHTCFAGGQADCVELCNYKKTFGFPVVPQQTSEKTVCVECGKPCNGISYCGCRGWD